MTDGMRREAQQQPGGHVYVMDPAYGPEDVVPGHAVLGAYAVDAAGQIVPGFLRNPKYRPSQPPERTPPG